MTVKIEPSRARGRVFAPPSKSMAHRLLIAAGLSGGVSLVRGVSACDDVAATVDCLSSLGVKVERSGKDFTVYGVAPRDMQPRGILPCRESGSTMRFFIPLALTLGTTVTLTGKKSLMARPMTVYDNICRERGYLFRQDVGGISVSGRLSGGIFNLPGDVSSQFISGLIFALPTVEGDSEIRITKPIESLSYIRLTLEAIGYFGIKAEFDEAAGIIYIPGAQSYTPKDVTVEGDYSGAAFTEAFNSLGGEVRVEGLRENSVQGDSVYRSYYKLLREGAPTLDIGDCPDLAPILFALAAALHGAKFTGTRRLKIKESDRAEAMKDELEKLGIAVTVLENEVTVEHSPLTAPTVPILSHNDHRIVMAMSVLLTLVGGEITGAEAIAKSYPEFFDDLQTLGVRIKRYEA